MEEAVNGLNAVRALLKSFSADCIARPADCFNRHCGGLVDVLVCSLCTQEWRRFIHLLISNCTNMLPTPEQQWRALRNQQRAASVSKDKTMPREQGGCSV